MGGVFTSKIRLQQSIPCFTISVNGEIKNDLTFFKLLSTLNEPGDTEIQCKIGDLKSNPDFSNKEKILSYFDDYSNIGEEYFKYSIFTFRQIISSITDLIPSVLDDEGKEMAQGCKKMSELLSDLLSICEEGIIRSIKDDSIGDDLSDLTKSKISNLKKQFLVYCLVDLNYLTTQIILYRQHIYDYYYGPKDKKADNKALIMELSSLILTPLKNIEKKTDQIVKNSQASIELENQIISNQAIDKEEASREHAIIQEEMKKEKRLERTKPLKLTTCLEAIKEVYEDPKYNYPQQFKLHQFAIRNQLSDWNQYLNTGGKKGKAPLPKFDFYRHTDKKAFKDWIRDVFFPDYRNRAHKDALTNASHYKKIEDIPDPNPQDIIDEVDQSLANDDLHNNNTNNNINNEQPAPHPRNIRKPIL